MNNDYSNRFNIDDARDTLDRINSLINACDTKASIVLGIVGVIGGICLNDSIILRVYNYLVKNLNTLKCKIFFVITCIIVLLAFFGVYRLASVLYARLKSDNKKSNIYFGEIAKYNNSMNYKKELLKMKESDLLDDYISQIYINSKICDKKYKLYNQGVIIVGISLALFIIDIIVFLVMR